MSLSISELTHLAYSRIGGKDGFEIISYGEIGEPSNGALMLTLAAQLHALDQEMTLRELHHFEVEQGNAELRAKMRVSE